jgi:hypothetical protein
MQSETRVLQHLDNSTAPAAIVKTHRAITCAIPIDCRHQHLCRAAGVLLYLAA